MPLSLTKNKTVYKDSGKGQETGTAGATATPSTREAPKSGGDW
jgi:hypothetical protein